MDQTTAVRENAIKERVVKEVAIKQSIKEEE